MAMKVKVSYKKDNDGRKAIVSCAKGCIELTERIVEDSLWVYEGTYLNTGIPSFRAYGCERIIPHVGYSVYDAEGNCCSSGAVTDSIGTEVSGIFHAISYVKKNIDQFLL